VHIPRWSFLAATVLLGACFVFRTMAVETVPPGEGTTVLSRARVHLLDGTTVVYPTGFTISGRLIQGTGTRYGLSLVALGGAGRVPLDSVVGIESYRQGTNVPATIAVSTLATAATAFGGALLAVAIFGSCPTFYSDSAGAQLLEAEGFSYSIAPIFEMRDVARLRAVPGRDGVLRLEVRNEALETHYLNHLEAIEVAHLPDETIVPDPAGHPVALRTGAAPLAALDRSGRDVLPLVAYADSLWYEAPQALLAAATEQDLHDFIDLDVSVPTGADSVAIGFRLRNSLLTTVLFYDLMLADRGAAAVDWIGRDLEELGPAVALGRWAHEAMGLGVSVRAGDGYREVARVPNVGPIAWKEVAVVVPVTERPVMRVRLASVIDDWRIDRVSVAAGWRRPDAVTRPITRVIRADGSADAGALAGLRSPDDRYLETGPGDRFTAEFGPMDVTGGTARTYLLGSQGYYIEWLRRSWLTPVNRVTPFEPGRPALFEAVRRWRIAQDTLEQRFYSTRIPVR
jgi:hypothetical protein